MNIKNWTKKSIVAAIGGAFIIGGIAAGTLGLDSIAHANPNDYNNCRNYDGAPRHHWRGEAPQPVDIAPEQTAQHLAEVFGCDKQAVIKHHNDGWNMQSLRHAAFIAYASEKSLDDVLAAKTAKNTWFDVGRELGVTREQVRTAHQTLQARHLAADTKLTEKQLSQFINEGYRAHDIRMAAAISQETAKSFEQVIGMKRINNSWFGVAKELGMDEAAFINCRDHLYSTSCYGDDDFSRGHNRRHRLGHW